MISHLQPVYPVRILIAQLLAVFCTSSHSFRPAFVLSADQQSLDRHQDADHTRRSDGGVEAFIVPWGGLSVKDESDGGPCTITDHLHQAGRGGALKVSGGVARAPSEVESGGGVEADH